MPTTSGTKFEFLKCVRRPREQIGGCVQPALHSDPSIEVEGLPTRQLIRALAGLWIFLLQITSHQPIPQPPQAPRSTSYGFRPASPISEPVSYWWSLRRFQCFLHCIIHVPDFFSVHHNILLRPSNVIGSRYLSP